MNLVDAHNDVSTFVFHQLPIVNANFYTAQYHVVVRVSVTSRGDVLSCEAQCFLISYERTQPLWPVHFDGDDLQSDQDQDVD